MPYTTWGPLAKYGDVCVRQFTKDEELVNALRTTDIAVIQKEMFTAEILSQLPRLKGVAVTATGRGNIKSELAELFGIDVRVVAGYARMPVADWADVIIGTHCRDIGELIRRTGRGEYLAQQLFFLPPKRRPRRLYGSKLGVIGCGAIGSRVAQLMLAKGVDVDAFDPFAQCNHPEPYAISGIEGWNGAEEHAGVFNWVGSKDEAITGKDFVTLHTTTTPGDPPIIGEREFTLMKMGTVLLNASRAEAVDYATSLMWLKSDPEAWFYSDVFYPEPPLRGTPEYMLWRKLWRTKRFKSSAHNAWYDGPSEVDVAKGTYLNVEGLVEAYYKRTDE